MNKTDKNDAHGIAQIMRCGWYKEVTIKSFENHESRALFRTRSNLVSMRTDVVNQIRGMLKTFGILIKGIAGKGFEEHIQEIIDEGSALAALLQVQLDMLRIIKQKINELDELVLDHAYLLMIRHFDRDKSCRFASGLSQSPSPLIERSNAVAFSMAEFSDGRPGIVETCDSLTPLPGELGVGKRVHGFLLEVEANLSR